MKRPLLGLAAGFLIAGCSTNDYASMEAQAQTAAANERVCETVQPTGSRLPKRICRRRSEIERDGEIMDDFFDRAQDRVPLSRGQQPGGTGSN